MATKVKLIADGVITPDQITLTTASTGTNTTAPATTAFVQQEISALVDSSPEALNTLNELAAALGDDANFSTTVTNSIATKAPLASPTFTGTVEIPNLTISSAQGTDGQVLTSTGSGIAWEDASGGVSGIVSSADATAITIDSSENVGIGTNIPDHKFHVDAGAPGSADKTLAAFSSERTLRDIGFVWDDSASTLGIATLTNHDLVFHTNGNSNERMRIDASGDITMSGTGSLKVPSGTSAQRPSSPTAGMMRYNSSNNELEVYTNMWTPIKTEAPLSLQQASTYHQKWTIAADGQSANAGSGYSAITVNLNFEGNFIVISKWSHDYMGIGIGYKAGITNANFTGESNDPVGPYGGDVNGDGFDSTVSYMGQYHWPISNGGANTHLTTYYIKHQRVGNTISTHYSTNSASGTDPNHASWTQVQSATISSTDHCKPVWGEASSQESLALTLLYNDISGGYNAS